MGQGAEEASVHWLDTDRSKLNHGSGWIENRMDIGKEETEGASRRSTSSHTGQVFLGNMGSFFSRAVYKQMIGRHNVVVPWTSIDGRPLDREWHEFLGREARDAKGTQRLRLTTAFPKE